MSTKTGKKSLNKGQSIRKKTCASPAGICFEALEPRLLLSGSWGAGVEASPAESQANTPGELGQETVALHADASLSDPQSWQHHRLQIIGRVDLIAKAPVLNAFPAGEALENADREAAPAEPASTTAAVRTHELVFVDAGIQNYAQLVDDIMSSQDDDRAFEIIILESDRDGVEQISRVLADRQDLDAVHFVTHGEAGAVKLGSTWLDSGNIDPYSGDIAGWQGALTPKADLLFYGCDLAARDAGRSLLDTLGNLTHADVAASDDLTGSARMGGDWVLEYSNGEIETRVVTSPEAPQHWSGVLATFTVTTTVDGAAGSLRQAITNANGNAEVDVINLPAGAYTLTLGELDISSEVTIAGAGAGTTIIDGNDAYRVFKLSNGAANLTLTDLTVQNGSDGSNGGGILVNNSAAQLSATRVIITGNNANDGAGIYNEGTITLTDVIISNNGDIDTAEGGGLNNRAIAILERVTISGNQADDGGGIHNDNSATSLSLSNVTVTGNTVTGKGGGLHSEAQATIVNSTFALNDANDGGGITNKAGSLSMTNVTVSGNTASSVGGGLFNQAQATIVNSTFTLNDANNGGGISNSGGTVNIQNTIVAGNTGANPDVESLFTSQGHNLIGDGTGSTGLINGVNDDQVGNAGSPINPLLGALKDNGGFTQTHALLGGSPAIDAGDNGVGITEDQRGFTRPIDGDGDATATTDIGAIEYTTASIGAVNEFRVNDVTETGRQETSGDLDHSQRAVALADDGSYVVVWSSEGQDAAGWGVYAQRFDKFGNELTGEILVNENEFGNERWARVASDSDGNFVVTWTTDLGIMSAGVYARRFDSSGTALGGAFVVNTTLPNDQQDSSVAMDAAGNFIVVWEGTGIGDSDGVFYRRFNADGTPMDMFEVRANLSTVGNQRDASVAINAVGDFVVVWEEGGRIKFQMFASDGTPGIADEVFNDTVSSNPDVAMDALGNFVVVYRWNGSSGQGIWGHQFDNTGTEQGLWWRVGPGGLSNNKDHTNPSISMDDVGNFIVTYESIAEGDVGNKTVFAERFQSDKTSLGVFQVNQTTAGDQHMASIAMSDLDNYVVAFTGEDADQTGVFVRQFGTAIVPTADPGGPYTISEGDTLNLDASASADPDGTIVSWDWDIGDNGSFEKTGETVSYNWAELIAAGIIDDGTVDVTLRVIDNDGAQTSQTFQVTVGNTAPTLAVSGNTTVDDGVLYTLNLSATDPGDDSMAWTINWGDGTVDSVAGSASSATHTYTGAGLTYNITVSASDEDGSYHDNQMLVADSAGDKIVRFAPGSNTVLGEFANGDLNSIDGAVIGPDAMLYAGSFAAGEIKRYDPLTGVRDISFLASDSLGQVAQMAFGPDGRLYVVNSNSDQILAFDTSLPNPTATVIIDGAGDFSSPMGLLFHPDGSIYVGGYASDNVVRYDASGNNPVEVANAADGINGAQFLALGPDGAVYIASTANDRIYHYDGSAVRLFASGGGVDGPLGVTLGPDGYLYVTSELNGIAEVFRYDTSNFVGSGYTPVAAEVYVDSGLTNPRGIVFIPSHQVTVNAVNQAPVLNAIGDQSIDELATLTFTASATDADLPANALSYSLDGASITAGMTIDAGTGVFSWTPTESQSGVHSVTVTVTDDGTGPLSDSETFDITVNELNVSPVLNAIGDQSIDELATLTFTASATDADLPANALSYSLDGASITAGMTIDAGTGVFSWTPTESQSGVHSVTVTVTDDGTGPLSDSETFDITVNELNVSPVLNAIGDQSIDELATLTFTASATDADLPANALSYSLDGASITAGMTIDAGTGVFSWTPTESQSGVHSVTVTVTDDGTGPLSDSETFDITVNELNVSPVLNAIGDQSIDELATLTFTASATDADLPANALSYSLDGASITAGMTIDAGTGVFSWTPTESQSGVHSVTVTVTDDGTGPLSDSETFDITVNELNVSPVLNAIGDQSIDELATLTFTASATDADLPANALSYSLDGASITAGMTIDAGTGVFSWTPTESQSGVHSVTVTVTDDGTGPLSDSETFDITVNELNVSPVLNAIGDQSIDELATLTFTASATDADLPANALSYSLDGASITAGMTIDAGTGVFSWTPTESQSGVHSVTVTVTDDGTGPLSDSETFDITVSVTAAVAVTPPPTTTVIDNPSDGGDTVEPEPDTPAETIEPITEPEAEPVETAPEAAALPVTVVDVQAPVSQAGSFVAARTPYLIKAAGQFTRVLATDPTLKAIVQRQLNTSSVLREAAPTDKGSQQADHQADLHNRVAARAYLNMVNSLDDVKKEMAGEIAFNKTVMGSAIAVSTGLSVGYVVWLIRGGMLLSSLLSSIPAWQILDPLPVLAGRRGEDDLDDDESLASIIDRKPEEKEPKKKPKRTVLVKQGET